MANQLQVAKVLSIQTLHAQGWSQRRIARELGINRETVARQLKEKSSKPAKAPTGSEEDSQQRSADKDPREAEPAGRDSESTGASSLSAEGGPSRSQCEPYRDVILAKLEQGLSAQRIFHV